jgi:hypothetical protein
MPIELEGAMRLLKISVTSMLAVATAVAIATPAYATKSPVNVSSQTGETYVAVAGGAQSGKGDPGLYPDADVVSDTVDDGFSYKKAPNVDRENAEFIAEQKDKVARDDYSGVSRDDANSSLTTKDGDALDKVSKDLDNLIGNVVNNATEDRKADKYTIDEVGGE